MPYKDKEKQREYQKLWVQKRRKDWIESQGSTCSDCGNTEGPWEVDHIDPESKISHNVWSWSKERRETELAKCQLLCELCHWSKTGKENSGWSHGSTGYYTYGCRCEICLTVSSAQRKANKLRKKKI